MQQFIEKYKGQKLANVFINVEKAYDAVSREMIWRALKKDRVPMVYIKILQNM